MFYRSLFIFTNSPSITITPTSVEIISLSPKEDKTVGYNTSHVFARKTKLLVTIRHVSPQEDKAIGYTSDGVPRKRKQTTVKEDDLSAKKDTDTGYSEIR